MIDFSNSPARYLFFTGQGGVGKTSLSCATAVGLADQGLRVFLVCTDPASNLNDVLGTTIDDIPTPVPGVPRLHAVNIDPEEAARRYRERVIEPYRDKLPKAALASMEEQLSGACTMEIAAFDKFVKLLGDPDVLQEHDRVIFDTAPTGHTLRLLQLPSAWDGFIETNTTGTSCLGPLAGLTRQHRIYKSAVATLADARQTTVVLVCRPDETSLTEAARTSYELSELGMKNQTMTINGRFTAACDDRIALAWQRRARKALDNLPEVLDGLQRTEVPLLPFSPLGVKGLRHFWRAVEGQKIGAPPVQPEAPLDLPPLLAELFAIIAEQGRGVIMTMGKGGVGKTTLATALAQYLADRDHPVLLATTDPAAHLNISAGNNRKKLAVRRIDPKAETRRYTQKVMAEAGSHLDDEGQRLLAEDLRSPCTEEIAVFQAFAQLIEQGTGKFVVVDTAPTGHTLLLLDAARAYHREVERTAGQMPEEIQKLLPRMRDPNYTKILIVTLPETTPIHEALQLEKDLQRAGINPFAWVINQSLAPLQVTDPLLAARRQAERAQIEHVTARFSSVYLAAWTEDGAAIIG